MISQIQHACTTKYPLSLVDMSTDSQIYSIDWLSNNTMIKAARKKHDPMYHN